MEKDRNNKEYRKDLHKVTEAWYEYILALTMGHPSEEFELFKNRVNELEPLIRDLHQQYISDVVLCKEPENCTENILWTNVRDVIDWFNFGGNIDSET